MDFSSFNKIFDIIEPSKQNVFLTGKAGTGKSSFLKFFKNKTSKKTIVLAPTGVSALNVQGQTIHSFFKFKTGFIDVEQANFVNTKKALYENIELLIIDEISMVRADLFAAIEKFLRFYGPQKGEIFGGVQLLVIGDMYQLPPVVSYNEREIYYSHYSGAFFFSGETFNKANFKIIELQNIYRQTEKDFIEILNKIRKGENNQAILDFINTAYSPSFSPEEEDRFTVLTAKKEQANNINESKLRELETEEKLYRGLIEGKFSHNENHLPAPMDLYLKTGAKVMFIKNDPEKKWVNGTLGTVVNLSEQEITVQVERNKYIKNFRVGRSQWDNINYVYDNNSGKMKEEKLGSYKQFPLIHAWAVTIHKAQGKTLDGAVIDIGNKAFCAGQLYVALSRCSSLKNIKLISLITARDVKCDYTVVNFFKRYSEESDIYSI